MDISSFEGLAANGRIRNTTTLLGETIYSCAIAEEIRARRPNAPVIVIDGEYRLDASLALISLKAVHTELTSEAALAKFMSSFDSPAHPHMGVSDLAGVFAAAVTFQYDHFGLQASTDWVAAKIGPVVASAIAKFEGNESFTRIVSKRRRPEKTGAQAPAAKKIKSDVSEDAQLGRQDRAPSDPSTAVPQSPDSSSSAGGFVSGSSSLQSIITEATSLPSSPILGVDPAAFAKAEPSSSSLAGIASPQTPASASTQSATPAANADQADVLQPPVLPFLSHGSSFVADPRSPGSIMSPPTVSPAVFARSPPQCGRCQTDCAHAWLSAAGNGKVLA